MATTAKAHNEFGENGTGFRFEKQVKVFKFDNITAKSLLVFTTQTNVVPTSLK